MPLTEARLRTKISKAAMDERVGKILTDSDYDILLHGPAKLYQPTGRPLAVYLPGALAAYVEDAYPILTTIREITDNRGLASGTAEKVKRGTQQRGKPVMSSILGAFEASGYYKYCRLTSWTARQMEGKWPELLPFLQAIGDEFKTHVPDRWAAQMKYADATQPEWMVRGTPFTTITVNNTYPTGVHKDAGDLDEGFSCLAVVRRGEFTGGYLTFPEYRVAVNMKDGDLLLMDAHAWHGNTRMHCACGTELSEGPCGECGAERISVVAYFRQNMTACGTAAAEAQKQLERAERVNASQPRPVTA